MQVNYGEERGGDQKIFVADITKANKLLGWTPKVSIDDGIIQTWDWITNNSV